MGDPGSTEKRAASAPRSGSWRRLVRPSPAVEDPGDRRRVRLLILLLLALTVSCLIGVIVRYMVQGDIGWGMVVATGILGLGYGLGRTRHHWVAAMIGVFALSMPSFTVTFQNLYTAPDMARHALIYLALPMLFASFVMQARGTAVTNCALLVLVLALLWVAPHEARRDILMAFSVLTITAVLAVGAAVVHHRDRLAVQEQLAERRRAEEALRRAKEGLEVRVIERTAELEQAHEHLRMSQKMEAIGQLAGGVAHDFNNLLTVINGHVDLLLTTDLKPSVREDLQDVYEAGERASVLTRQLMAFGRKQVLQVRVIDLNTIIEEMSKMLRRLIREDVALELRLGADLAKVEVDPGQMEQVIINLVVNASDAMTQGGELLLETANADPAPQPDGAPVPRVMLAVSDSGAGMSAEVQKRIFEPFFTTKGLGRGTGLGLATVYGIVNQSGGEIEVESSVDEGSTFRVYLPQTLQSGVEASGEQLEPPKGSETILLVEDEEAVRELTARMLRGLGYKVLTASNGRVALEHCSREEQPIDLLLSDVVMPEMGGPECAAQARELRPTLPVLYMSGYADEALAPREVLEDDAVLVHKPFNLRELGEYVRGALDSDPRQEQQE